MTFDLGGFSSLIQSITNPSHFYSDCFRSETSFHNNIRKFLVQAKSGSKGIDLVLYSNAEHHELYRSIGKKVVAPHVTNTYVYEDLVLNTNLNPISSTEWRANKWVLKLRELFSKTTKDKFKKKKFRHAISPSRLEIFNSSENFQMT